MHVRKPLLFFNRYIGGDCTRSKSNRIFGRISLFSMLLTQDAMLCAIRVSTNVPTCRDGAVRSSIIEAPLQWT